MSLTKVFTTPDVLLSFIDSTYSAEFPPRRYWSGTLACLTPEDAASVLRLSRVVSDAVPRGIFFRWIESMQETLFAGGLSGLVCVFGGMSMRSLADSRPVAAMEWCPSGLRLAVGYDTGMFYIHTQHPAETGLTSKMVMHHGRIGYLAWNPSGSAVATSCATDDLALRIIEVPSASVSIRVQHHLSPAAIGWSTTGTCVATVCEKRSFLANGPDSILCLTDAATGTMTKLEHGSPIVSLAFNPSADEIATGTLDGTLRVFNTLHTPYQLVKPLATFPGKLRPVAWDPRGRLIALAFCTQHGQAQLCILDGVAGNTRHQIWYKHKISELQWAPDGEHLATVSQGTVHVVNACSGLVKYFLDAGPSSPLRMAWCPAGESLALFGTGNAELQVIQILNIRSGGIYSLEYAGDLLQGTFGISSLSWSPSGRFLAMISCSCTDDQEEVVAVIDAVTGAVRKQIKHRDATILAWRP